jgi:hypothetical protein
MIIDPFDHIICVIYHLHNCGSELEDIACDQVGLRFMSDLGMISRHIIPTILA